MAKFRGKIQDGTIDIPDLIIKIALIWFILTFLVFPNVNLLLRVFVKDEHFTMEAVSKIMRSARAMKSLKNSFILAIASIITATGRRPISCRPLWSTMRSTPTAAMAIMPAPA